MGAAAAQAPLKIVRSRESRVPSGPARAIVENLRTRKSACFRVTGRSMWPALRRGDLVFAKALSMDRISTGQIVAFEREERVFVHRVLWCRNACETKLGVAALKTKGDTLNGPDPLISTCEYLGCVIRVHRGRRHIDMQSLGHRVAGAVMAAISPASRIVFGPVRALRAILRSR